MILPTAYTAHDLREFVEALRKITPSSLYFHVFESRLRLKNGTNDFVVWLADDMDEKALSQEIAKIDPYTYTFGGIKIATNTNYRKTHQIKLTDYEPIVGKSAIEELKLLTSSLQGKIIQNITSTFSGGGVAEILNRMIPFLEQLGVDARWNIIEGFLSHRLA